VNDHEKVALHPLKFVGYGQFPALPVWTWLHIGVCFPGSGKVVQFLKFGRWLRHLRSLGEGGSAEK